MSNGATTWLIPPGVILAWGGADPDTNPPCLGSYWLYCNGGTFTQATQPGLATAIGSSFGGDGNPTYYLPDLRGYFLRGVDDGADRDPDVSSRTTGPNGGNSGTTSNTVGSVEGGSVESGLSAAVPVQYSPDPNGDYATFGFNDNYILGGQLNNEPTMENIYAPISGSGAETRPINIYVYYIICTGIPMPSSS